MSVRITNTADPAYMGTSSGKTFAIAPDGTYWLMLAESNVIRFWYSNDSGITWTYAVNGQIDLPAHMTRVYPSIFIDTEGVALVSVTDWQGTAKYTYLYRGRRITTNNGTTKAWEWRVGRSAASRNIGVASDVVAWMDGAIRKVIIAVNGEGGERGAYTILVTMPSGVNVDWVWDNDFGPFYTGQPGMGNAVEIAHDGDGRTMGTVKYFYHVRGVRNATSNLVINRADRTGPGVYSWGADYLVTSGVNLTNLSAIRLLWTGNSLFVCWISDRTIVNVRELSGGFVTNVARNPPTLPGGMGLLSGLTVGLDPQTDDIYMMTYGTADSDAIWTRFNRATNTWEPWVSAVERGAMEGTHKLALPVAFQNASVDFIYGNGAAPGPYSVAASRITTLVRDPIAPSLYSPASGSQISLASGGIFRWRYTPVAPGDSQYSFAFRRTATATGVTQYWNAASQSWQATQIFNPTSPRLGTEPYENVVFPAGRWSDGVTYTWTVAVQSDSGGTSPFASPSTVIVTEAPDVVVTDPDGLVFGETNPVVRWTYSGGSPQTAWTLRIVEVTGAAISETNPQPTVYTAGGTSAPNTRSHRIGTPLVPGKTYRAYVKVYNGAVLDSPWRYSEFVLSGNPPSAPTVATWDIADYATGVPRARLEVTASTNFLTKAASNGSTTGWDNYANATLSSVAANPGTATIDALRITAAGPGAAGAITKPGSPPPAPLGEPQPAGPLDFAVTAATSYTATAMVRRLGATSRSMRIGIAWYSRDDGLAASAGSGAESASDAIDEVVTEIFGTATSTVDSLILTTWSDPVVAPDDTYAEIALVVDPPPAAKRGRMIIEVVSAGTGEAFEAGRIDFHPGRSTQFSPGGYVGQQSVRVERSDDGGDTWSPVAQQVSADVYQRAVVDDRSMPMGVEVAYRAYTDVTVGSSGSVLSSTPSAPSYVTVVAEAWAIRDLSQGGGEMNAYVTDASSADENASAVFRPLGRSYPVIDTEGVDAETGSLEIYVPHGQRALARKILRSNGIVTMQSPLGRIIRAHLTGRTYAAAEAGAETVDVDYVEVG